MSALLRLNTVSEAQDFVSIALLPFSQLITSALAVTFASVSAHEGLQGRFQSGLLSPNLSVTNI